MTCDLSSYQAIPDEICKPEGKITTELTENTERFS
ncbi:hypothetical protein SCG7086_AC_00420 [Chlamydiales bacterium SCGC AG-110-P3]|nr:hypothetical protein SCG7086_AC_00420 [Chlamydiales bacterium SCGC AG-110-P3]